MSNWLHSGASVVGQSHLTTSTPCQDKFEIQTSGDGEWLAIAVCDGAGSAEFAEIGASVTSNHFCKELIKLSQELSTRLPGEWINDFVIDCVIRVREQLRKVAKSDDIRKYHCTLVAALIGKSGGFSIHIGDGALLGGSFAQTSNSGPIELNSDFFISKPENGEYANETYFITEGSWVKHLRISPLPALDWLIVCTDGGASLALDNELDVKPNFVAPFIEAQINQKFADSSYVENILSDSKANKLTTDDKTIILAVRNISITLPTNFQFSSIEKNAPLKRSNPSSADPVTRTTVKNIDPRTASNSKPPASRTKSASTSTRPKSSLKRNLVLGFSSLIVLALLISGALYFYLNSKSLPASKSTAASPAKATAEKNTNSASPSNSDAETKTGTESTNEKIVNEAPSR